MCLKQGLLSSVSIVAFSLALGSAEAAYVELEDPFGQDFNDSFATAELVPLSENVVEAFLSEFDFDFYGDFYGGGGEGDVDFFRYEGLTPGSAVFFEVANADRSGGGASPNWADADSPFSEFDSVLGVFDSSGAEIANDDQSGVGSFSRVAAIVPADGTLVVAVGGFDDLNFDGTGNFGQFGDYDLIRGTVPLPNIAVDPENILLDPIIDEDGNEFTFNDTDVNEPGQIFVFDPFVAVGYEIAILDGPGFFADFMAPTVPGDDGTYLLEYDGGSMLIDADVLYDLSALELTAFTLTGIDTAAMLDPSNPFAFAWAGSFTLAGEYDVSMTAIEVFVPDAVPAPVAALLLAPAVFAAARYRRR